MKIHRRVCTIAGGTIFRQIGSLGILLGIACTFLLLLPTYSQDEMGVIHGKLTDQQLNEPIANHPVTLNIHKAENVTKKGTESDENGIYRFEDLPIDVETHYTLSTIYDNIEHIEKDLVLNSFVPSLTIDMNIGGKTDDPSQIRKKSHTFVIGFPPEGHPPDGAVLIIEAFNIDNLGDLSFEMNYQNDDVGFYAVLPEGIEDIRPHAPEDLMLHSSSRHVIFPKPLPPGSTEVGFQYITHVHENKLDLSQRISFPTDQISLLIQEGINLVPISKQFTRAKSEPIHNLVYGVYIAKPTSGYLPGDKVDLRMGIPGQESSGQKPNMGQMVFIAVASALTGGFLVAAIFMLRGARRPSSGSEESENIGRNAGWLRKLNNADITHAKTARLEFITLLDDMHEKQNISERVYNRLRREQTEYLTEILNQHTERGLDK